jgi:hypothetical protein
VTGNHRSYRRPYPQRLLATLDLFAEDDSFLSLAVAGRPSATADSFPLAATAATTVALGR